MSTATLSSVARDLSLPFQVLQAMPLCARIACRGSASNSTTARAWQAYLGGRAVRGTALIPIAGIGTDPYRWVSRTGPPTKGYANRPLWRIWLGASYPHNGQRLASIFKTL